MTEPTHSPTSPSPAQCYRHPATAAAVTCSGCGRPICPDCMVDAGGAFQCPECVRASGRVPQPDYGVAAPPQRRAPWRMATPGGGISVTLVLIGLNVAAFLISFSDPDSAAFDAGLYWLGRAGRHAPVMGVGAGEYWRLVSSMFLHGGIAHVAMNMLALYVFGTQLERVVGRVWFLALYLTAGVASGATFLVLEPAGMAVGASGAIFGLFGAMLALIIARRHTAEGRAMLQQFVGLLIVNLLFSLMPGIAWQAHLGGFVVGFALGWVLDHTHNVGLRLLPFGVALGATAFVAVAGPFF